MPVTTRSTAVSAAASNAASLSAPNVSSFYSYVLAIKLTGYANYSLWLQ